MQKRLLLLSLSVLTISANAQQNTNAFLQKIGQLKHKRHSANVSAILHDQVKGHNKTTASNERLAADRISLYDGVGWEAIDSNRYMYSGGRGSMFDLNDMYYSDYVNGTWAVAYDSFTNYSINGAGLAVNAAATAVYDGSNRKTLRTDLGNNNPGEPLENSNRTSYGYDANGNIVLTYTLNWNSGGSWDTVQMGSNVYNSSNKLTSTVYAQRIGNGWEETYKEENTYDGSGNLAQTLSFVKTGGTWIPGSRESFTYYTNNKLKESLRESNDGSGWSIVEKDTIGYTTGVDVYTFLETRSWNEDSSKWENYFLEKRELNSQNLPEVTSYYEPDTTTGVYELNYENIWTYNAADNPVSTEGLLYVSGNPIPVFLEVFYYEARWDLGVNEMRKNDAFTMYPNPANNVLHIKALNATGNVMLQLMNTMGQLMVKTNANAHGIINMDISNVQPGSYMLMITDRTGNRIYTQPVIKQ